MSVRGASAALLLLACSGGVGTLVELDGTLPAEADTVTVTVLDRRVLESRTFQLDGRVLPQTVGINSRGQSRGPLLVVARATADLRVVASGWTEVELGRGDGRATLTLSTVCSGAGCGCMPSNCVRRNAGCGALDDGCAGVIDCGDCPMGSTCTAIDAGVLCADRCTPRGCAPGGCGLIEDGCGGVVACGPCDGG